MQNTSKNIALDYFRVNQILDLWFVIQLFYYGLRQEELKTHDKNSVVKKRGKGSGENVTEIRNRPP